MGRFYYIVAYFPNMTEPKPYPSILQGFGLIIVALAYSILFALLSELITSMVGSGMSNNAIYKGVKGLFLYVIPVAATYFFAVKQRNRSGITEGMSFKPFSLTIFTVGFAVIFCMGFLTELFDYFVPPTDSFIRLIENVIGLDAFSVIAAVVAAPILEELLMRGIILDGFLKRYSPAKSILWSAVIFGVFHLNPWQAVGAFAIGLLLGWLYWKTKSLTLCILLHAANNATAFLVVSMIGKDKMNHSDSLVDYMGMANYLVGFAVVLIVLIGCKRFLNRHFKKQLPAEGQSGNLPI